MKLGDALSLAASELRQNGIEDPSSEAAVLLCYLLQIDQSRLYAQPERDLAPGEITALDVLVARRCSGEPSAYIRQGREFYGIDIYVDARVLVPRPETELLVDAVIHFTRAHPRPEGNPWLIADAGTGSGAIAIALALHIPGSHIYAADISSNALEVAAINISRQGLAERITLLQGNLLEPLEAGVDIIVANLPYIPDSDHAGLQREVAGHEPELALKGGRLGTELILELIARSGEKLLPGGAMFVEIGPGQENELLPHARSVFSGANVSVLSDYAGINRVIAIVN